MPSESASDNIMLARVKAIIPALEHGLHKGQAGRIGVVGGSLEYTGAPYYSAISALRCGADLSFVFCGQDAAALPLKSYSPELIVYPSILPHFATVLPRLSSAVFGPGLGRDPAVLQQCAEAVLLARQHGLPIVLDGDALWLLKDMPELVRGYAKAIITPNQAEFARLLAAANITTSSSPPPAAPSAAAAAAIDISVEPALSVAKLARWLDGATVLRKARVDVISDGKQAVAVSAELGSARRCGGQGDVLAGACAVFSGWSQGGGGDTVASAYAAAVLTRRANARGFAQHGRSMTTPDLIHHLGPAFAELFEEEDKACL